MKTISLIDLLKKVSNNEEVPNTIKYNNITFNWTGLNYYSKERDEFLDSHICLEDLNYPVEIVKQINKLNYSFYVDETKHLNKYNYMENNRKLSKYLQTISDKVDEIIDVVNK